MGSARKGRMVATLVRLTPRHDEMLERHAERLDVSKAQLARSILIRDLEGKRTLEHEELIDKLATCQGALEGKLQLLEDEVFELRRAVTRLLWRLGFAPPPEEGEGQ
jgi:hypothetical protein